MPRIARIVIPGLPHHIVQRGNNRQDVFFVDDDRGTYLALLHEQAALYGLTVWGYCLMSNHVHIVATPRDEFGIARAIGRTHFRYSQYVNRLHGRSGHLWQGRFYSAALDEDHFWAALCYVERNPVRARLARRAWLYSWSSAAAHGGRRQTDELLDLAEWRKISKGLNWPQLLASPEDDDKIRALRVHTHTGRPLGSDTFLAKLERKLGHRVRPLPIGRPPRRTAKRK